LAARLNLISRVGATDKGATLGGARLATRTRAMLQASGVNREDFGGSIGKPQLRWRAMREFMSSAEYSIRDLSCPRSSRICGPNYAAAWRELGGRQQHLLRLAVPSV
jgi:hypothetical protein